MDKIRKLDAGVQILVTIYSPDGEVVDVSTATLIAFKFDKPQDSTVLETTGSFYTDGSDGKVYYTTQTGEMDQVGIWKYQVYITMGGGILHTRQEKFRVEPIIV